jgi:amino acid permease
MSASDKSLQTMTHHDDRDDHNVRSALVPAQEDGSEASCCKCRFPHFNLLPHGSMAASGFNLASATLGAGTLAIPQAMAYCGYLVGSILLILCCAGTVYSIRLLIIVLEKTGFSTYEEMSHKLVHPVFEKITAGLIIAFCWGITIVYVVAMGDILDPLRQISGFPEALEGTWGRRAIMTIFWALFMLPLSLAKEINTLRYASLIGMASTAFLVAAVVTHTSIDAPPMENLTIARFDVNMIMSMSVFIFAYCCQTNCFEIYAEMTNRSVNKMTLTSAIAMTTCTIIYIIAGIAGAADFGQDTDGNILKNYKNPTETLYIAFAFVAISITLTMAFPICIFPTRDAILQMCGYKDAYSTPSHVRLLCAGVLATTAITVGLFVPGIQVLFGVLGGICGSTLAFIWPALFILRTGEWTRETAALGNMIATYALLILGTVAGLLATATSLYSNFS